MSALRDRDSVGRIQVRLDRLRFVNRGDARSLRHGLWELRIDAGPGYRVYFTYEAKAMVLLLCAGDKSTQKRDIRRAREFLEDYLRRSDA